MSMKLMTNAIPRSRRTYAIVGLVLVTCYLVYQLFSGNRGFLTLFTLSEKSTVLEREIRSLEIQHKELEKKVQMLKPESLNLDLLDEQVRRKLSYGKNGETVYLDKGIE